MSRGPTARHGVSRAGAGDARSPLPQGEVSPGPHRSGRYPRQPGSPDQLEETYTPVPRKQGCYSRPIVLGRSQNLSGEVPPHPERSNRNAVATATTSRTLIPDMCLTPRRFAATRPTTDELSVLRAVHEVNQVSRERLRHFRGPRINLREVPREFAVVFGPFRAGVITFSRSQDGALGTCFGPYGA